MAETQTTVLAGRETVAAVVARHKRELRDALDHETLAARQAAAAAQNAVRADAAAAVDAAIAVVRSRVLADRNRDDLAVIFGGPPADLLHALRRQSEALALTGQPGPAALLLLPRPDANGRQQRLEAWALVDVSRDVWG